MLHQKIWNIKPAFKTQYYKKAFHQEGFFIIS